MNKSFIIFFLCFPSLLFSQTYEWATGFGAGLTDIGSDIVVNAAGNVFHGGIFSGNADFDPGSGSLNLTGSTNGSAFIRQLDAAGDLVWAKHLAGPGSSNVEGISLDAAGNIYITGSFTDTVDFDPGAGIMNLIANAGALASGNIYVLKLDPMGDLIWVKHMESPGSGASFSRGITVDDAANVYITGEFEDSVDFDPGIGTAYLVASAQRDGFIQKLDTDGNLIWVSQLESTEIAVGNALAVNAGGEVFITGRFSGTTDFDPGAATLNLTETGTGLHADAFILKLTAMGDLAWVKQLGDGENGPEVGHDIQLDTTGNIYVVGEFQEGLDLDPGSGTMNVSSLGASDIFFIKLDAVGNFIWGKQFGGSGLEICLSLQLDAGGNLYSTGGYQDTVAFSSVSGPDTLISSGNIDQFVLKLTNTGDILWTSTVGGLGSEYGYSLALHQASSSLYTTGHFQDTVDFDPGMGIDNIIPDGLDGFVQKLSVRFSTPVEALQEAQVLKIYPNPGTSEVIIEAESALGEIRIYNQAGQDMGSWLREISRDLDRIYLDISLFPAGMYYLVTPISRGAFIKQ